MIIGILLIKYEIKLMSAWKAYIVRCSDDSLYTGITMNVTRRVAEHNSDGILAAKYTYSRCPVTLVYTENFNTRQEASRREYEIKKMSKKEKLMLIMDVNIIDNVTR